MKLIRVRRVAGDRYMCAVSDGRTVRDFVQMSDSAGQAMLGHGAAKCVLVEYQAPKRFSSIVQEQTIFEKVFLASEPIQFGPGVVIVSRTNIDPAEGVVDE